MTEEKISAPASHWRRRAKSVPIPRDQAVRQGDISRLAFLSLGKEAAIAFLNADLPELGGRPLAVATASEAGAVKVRAMLEDGSAAEIGEARRASEALQSAEEPTEQLAGE
ncbi:hypothetical protein [Tsuneonella sp. HG222]